MIDLNNKILTLEELPKWRDKLPENTKLIVTNGCFDVLHIGHIHHLIRGKKLGGENSVFLVGLNSDSSVKQLKGDSRPINTEQDRAEMLAALSFIDFICIFPETTSTNFLDLARPNIFFKGIDYTHNLDSEERRIANKHGAQIVFDTVPKKSSTELLQKIKVNG